MSASRPLLSAIPFKILTFSSSSLRKLFTFALLFSSEPKIFFNFINGINLAILSASGNGKSKTLAVSLIEDFAAMVP